MRINNVNIHPDARGAFDAHGVYETPGGTLLRAAHMDLEGIWSAKKLQYMMSEKRFYLITKRTKAYRVNVFMEVIIEIIS